MDTDSPKPAHNPMLSCCEHLFSLAAPLKDDQKASSVDMDFRGKVLTDFIAMEKAAFELQIGMVEFKDAKYALAAYIDEVVLTSTWPGRLEWISRPLQLEFFGEHTAGEGFFTRLANLRQGGEDNLHLLELFYYCLQLGFEGVYKIKGLEHLMALQVDLRSQMDGYRGPVKTQVAPEGLPGNVLINQVRRHVPYWVIAVVAIATVFFTYLGYSFVSDNVAESSVATVLKNKDIIVKIPGNAY
jgi:type VI secretion system protein ImpK